MDINKKFERHFVKSRDQIKKDPSAVGKAVYDILKRPQQSLLVEDILDQYQHAYVEKMREVVQDEIKNYEPPFYIVVFSKKEHWCELVMRNWFVARQTCPSPKFLRHEFPNHMHTVYSYDKRSDRIEVLWTLPTKQDADTVLKNRHLYDPALVKYITDFEKNLLHPACMEI